MLQFSAAVLTVSDSAARGLRADLSGPAVVEALRAAQYNVLHAEVVADDNELIQSALIRMSDQARLVVTTGGTGIAPRDVTPEATRAVCSRLIEGLPERMRALGSQTTPMAVLSRAVCGIRNGSLILNLPGSPIAARQSLAAVIQLIPHVLDLIAGKTEHK
jgi:molybdenum cofactor synthesis domain-containing protein